MPIPVECDYCGARYQVPDQAAGKTVKCKTCAERISVGGSSSGGLPPRATGPGKKKNTRQPKQSSNTGLLIGGIISGVALIAGIVAIVMMSSGGDDNVAGNDPTAASDPSGANKNAGGANSQPAPDPGGGFQQPSVTENGNRQAPDTELGLTFARSANWSVQPDPPKGETQFAVEKPLTAKLSSDNFRGAGVIFPTAPSALAGVQGNQGSKYFYTIYNAITGKEVAEVTSPGSITCSALSEDGSYLAVASVGGTKIDVWDIVADKSLGTLPSGEGKKDYISQIAVFGKEKMVGVSALGHFIKVWELPSGNVVREIKTTEKFSPQTGYAFSPGGKYLAVVSDYLTIQIDVYDLESGTVAGSIVPGGKKTTFALGALGFSRDGSQLSVLYKMTGFSRMMIWDLKTSNVSADFNLEPSLKEQLEPVYQSATLESFPGNQHWLVNSLGVVDVSSKQLVYRFPKQQQVSLHPSRRVLGAESLLSVSTGSGDSRLEVLSVTQDQLLAGANTASAGGFASDIDLPPLTPADFQKATDALANDEWIFKPEALESQAVKETISFSSEGTVRDIALSRNAAPVVAVRAGVDEDLNDPALAAYEKMKEMTVDKSYDYKKVEPVGTETELLAFQADGTPAAKFKFPFSSSLRGLSPDGTQALFEEHRTNGRLDIFEVADAGRRILGWRPYRTAEKKEHRDIKAAAFIDDDHVATLSMNYVLVVWNIQELKPIWKLDEVLHFVVSPTGSGIVAVRGGILGSKAVAVLDSHSGKGLGSVELAGPTKAIALHPNGQWLALSQVSGPNKVLRVLDLATGQVFEEFPVPSNGSSLTWIEDDYLLLDGTQLISRPLQAVVWSYEAENVRLPEIQVTGNLCVAKQLSGKRAAIRSLTIPSGRVASKLDPDQLKDQAILSPGDAVRLNVSVANNPLLKPLQGKATELFTKSLQQSQKSVTGNAGVTVSTKLSLESQGSTEVSKLGSRSEKVSVNRQSVKIDISYQTGGKTIFSTTRNVGNLDKFVQRIQQGKSVQESIDLQMIESVESLLSTLKLPTYIFGDNAKQGLGTSKLLQ